MDEILKEIVQWEKDFVFISEQRNNAPKSVRCAIEYFIDELCEYLTKKYCPFSSGYSTNSFVTKRDADEIHIVKRITPGFGNWFVFNTEQHEYLYIEDLRNIIKI